MLLLLHVSLVTVNTLVTIVLAVAFLTQSWESAGGAVPTRILDGSTQVCNL